MNEQGKARFRSWSLLLVLLGVVALVGFWAAGERAVLADKTPPPTADVLAAIGDVKITVEDVESANAEQFLQLRRERHEALESGLGGVVDQKVLELEAAAQGVETGELIENNVQAKVTDPTQEEIDAFYEQNKARIREPKESIAGRIGDYLRDQQRQRLQREYLDSLRAKYQVEVYLEPLRTEVETAGHPSVGPEDAPVTIVEFSDFECPYCGRVVPTLERVREEYGDDVRLVFRQFPLHQIHPNAQKAAEASLCALDQDKFWAMHDTLFEEQKALSVEQLKEKAVRIGLDADQFNACLDSGEHADRVYADVEAGRQAGVSGTPALFINGRFLNGAQPFEAIARVVDDELDQADQLD